MSSIRDSGFSDGGFVAKTSIEVIRDGVDKVLHEYKEYVEGPNKTRKEMGAPIKEGDSIVFREEIEPCPAILVATMLKEDTWLIIATSDCPPSKCDDIQAMKCGRLNEQNLRIMIDFVAPRGKVQTVSTWRIDLADDSRVQTIIDRATQRWDTMQ